MAYSDILNTTSLYGNLLNKNWANAGNNLNPNEFNDLSINPNSSGAFTPRSSRNIYNRPMNVTNEMESFSDYDPWSLQGGTQQVMQGLQYGKIGKTMSPYISDLGKGLSNTFRGNDWGASMKGAPILDAAGKVIGNEVLTGKYGSYGEMGDLGPASTVYGLTQNQNPYDHTKTEHLGTMASTAMAAKAIAPMVGLAGTAGNMVLGMNPYVLAASLFIGNWFSKKKKKKAIKMQEGAIEDFEGKQDEIYEARSESVEDMREEMLSEQQSSMYEQRQGQYDNQYGGNYSDYRGEEGMKFSPNELAKLGRNGDTQLAHINPQEAQMLKAMGGSGTINPYTGLPEYHWKLSASHMLKHAAGTVSDVLQGAGSALGNIIEPVFDAAGNVVAPVMEGAGNVVNTVGEEVFTPVVKGIASGARDIVKGAGEAGTKIVRAVGEPTLNILDNFIEGVGNLFSSSGEDGTYSPYTEGAKPDINRDPLEKDNQLSQGKLSGIKQNKPSGLDKRNKPTLEQGDWVGDKPNPYIAPNVEEEIDYANKGMKYKYDEGGKANVVAEFTGNELIVNDQDAVEKALVNKNYSKAANSIRNAMQKQQLTPGPETHQGNPMPVDDKGNIYAGGGTLPFKVSKGAGIYDHATDQFNATMTDKEISMVAQNNINKWKSNNMYA